MPRAIAMLALCVMILQAALSQAAEPRVEIEVATQPGFAIGGAQRWQKLLVEAGFDNVRIRGVRGEDEPGVRVTGTETNPSYKLTGILTQREKLVLTGASFTARDLAALKRYLKALRQDGVEGVTQRKGVFGLTAKQLLAVNQVLTPPVVIATKGGKPTEVLPRITTALQIKVVYDAAAQAALRQGEPCLDDVQGMTSGTGLAALLRPYGLVLRPYRPQGGELQLVITPAQAGAENWPVGWAGQKKERDVLPVLFEFLTVEIDGVTMQTALDALQPRIKVPFLYDHNALARHRVKPDEIKVSLPTGRSYYSKILQRVLLAGRLKYEVRLDEAGSPFIWITTIRD